MNSTSPDALPPPCGYTGGLKGYRPGWDLAPSRKGQKEEDVAIHTEQSWKRHSNPWSVWTRILSYPLAYVPVWNRCWKQGALVGAWLTANPVIFPAPEDDSSWATRCVLGEQLWTAKRRDFPMALNSASAVFYAGALLVAYKRRFWPLMFFGGTSYLLKLWFLDRMTYYYEEHRGREELPKEEAEAATTPSSA
jgi:hypothetical protein